MKKIIKEFWILAILLSVGLSGYAYDFEVGGIYYSKNSDGKTVYVSSGDNNYSGSVVIPSTVTDSGTTYSVTSIGGHAFTNSSGLTSVTIGNSVTSIGDVAFENCSRLTSVTIGNSVTSIGSSAFYGCRGLTSVTIPNSVTEIGGEAFLGCSGLKSVTIGNSVTSIGGYAFKNCSGLTSVVFNAENCTYKGNSGYPVFDGCPNLTSLTIGKNVKTIPSSAFSNCIGLTSVVFNAENCTTMGSSSYPVFNGCSNLTSLTIGENVKTIPDYAFYNCSGLTSVTIPNSVTSIGKSAFENCKGLTKVEISDIAAWCNISFGEFGANPLCNAHHLYLNGKEVTNLVIPNSVTSIGNYAFRDCSGLTSVTIPNSVTSIGVSTFSGCGGLTSVTIGNSVTSIGAYAFRFCNNIMSFESLNTTPPTLPSEDVFGYIPTECTLFVPKASIEAYKVATGWTYFNKVYDVEYSKVESIGSEASKVTVEGGAIHVEGAEGTEAEVYSLSGALLYRGTDSTIALPRGIYIVKVAGTTTKVIL